MLGLFASNFARVSAAKHATGVAQSAHSAADRARTETELLNVDIEKLYLITQALWTIMKEQHGYTDEELAAKVTELDLLDGKLDGKLERAPERPLCSECGRKLMARRNICMYCGHRQTVDPFDR
ncbi:MAG: hypothetical protein AAF802_04890 [Planctomycetota bacterium]